MKNFCIIPARSGSKRLPNKNIKVFKGKPIIEWTIKSAINSKIFDKIVISGDSEKLQELALKNNVVYFDRRGKHIDDESSVVDVCLEVLKNEIHEKFDFLWCLYATSPMRNEKDLINMKEILQEKKADSICAVTDYQHYAHQALVEVDGYLQPMWPKLFSKKSNLIPKLYCNNGSTYAVSFDSFMRKKSFFTKKTLKYDMPFQKSVDIDTQNDFDILLKLNS